jgi:hypothetical protein
MQAEGLTGNAEYIPSNQSWTPHFAQLLMEITEVMLIPSSQGKQ